MQVDKTPLDGVLLLTPRRFSDSRGYFFETYSRPRYAAEGIAEEFVQDNVSLSSKGVLRGLHIQNPSSQGKLVYVLAGTVFDVAVDVRVGSPHFAQWFGVELSSENGRQLWIPPGFAHGFVALSDDAVFAYKCTALYDPASEFSIRWNDPQIGIAWPDVEPVLSPKDAEAPLLAEVSGRLPRVATQG